MTRTERFDNEHLMQSRITASRACLLNARLATSRLEIEPLTASHAASLFALMQDVEIYRWISASAPLAADQLAEKWAQRESRLSPDGSEAWLNWAVRRISDGAYVGKPDAVVDGANIATNVGYFFFPPYWGEGFASEAVGAVADHLVAQGVVELRATVTLGNAASCRVLEKSGFTRTRVIVGNDMIRGVKHDDIEFARLAGKPLNG